MDQVPHCSRNEQLYRIAFEPKAVNVTVGSCFNSHNFLHLVEIIKFIAASGPRLTRAQLILSRPFDGTHKTEPIESYRFLSNTPSTLLRHLCPLRSYSLCMLCVGVGYPDFGERGSRKASKGAPFDRAPGVS
jgi:hypothetical protein